MGISYKIKVFQNTQFRSGRIDEFHAAVFDISCDPILEMYRASVKFDDRQE